MEDGAVPAGYEFVRVLGSGGFGEVVLARHLALGRLVAVKRIHAVALADEESVARFRREARLLATLDCSSVVRVYDLVVGPRQAHLVMEYVPGEALSELLHRGPLPADEALPVLRDAADALRAAAERGIVHRDVKPHNVFVLPDGRAKLGDFGLARAVSDPGVFRTAVGVALGTPAYYPPELGRGEGEPDERSDAYSFAVVAYETLTGRRPYVEADAIALITAHWRLEPPDPRTLLPGLPARAADALLAGLSKDPSRRPLPAELVSRLEAVPADRWPRVDRSPPGAPDPATQRAAPTVLVAAPRPTPTPPAPRRERHTTLLAVGAALVLGVVAAAAYARWGDPPGGTAGPLTVSSIRLETEPDPAVVTCPRGEVELVATLATNGAAGTVTVRWTGPAGELLAARDVPVSAGSRAVETHLRLTLSGREELRGPATVTVVGSEVVASRPVVYGCPPP